MLVEPPLLPKTPQSQFGQSQSGQSQSGQSQSGQSQSGQSHFAQPRTRGSATGGPFTDGPRHRSDITHPTPRRVPDPRRFDRAGKRGERPGDRPGDRRDQRRHTAILDLIRRWKPSPSVSILTVGGTALAYATTSIFVRHLTATGMSVIAVSFYRFLLTAVVLARYVNVAPYARTATRWGLTSGAVMGVGWIVYVNTIADTDVAIAGVIQMTYPLFAVIAGWVFFANRPNLRSIAAGVVIVVAAAIGLGATSGSGIAGGISAWLFVAPATFGFSVAILTERLGVLDPFERLGSVTVGATAAMSPLVISLRPEELLPQTIGAIGWVFAIGAVSALIPMVAYAAAAPVIGTARTVAAGSIELPTMFVIGAIAFGEAIHLRHLLAAALIVGAIALSNRSRSPHVIPDNDLMPDDMYSPT